MQSLDRDSFLIDIRLKTLTYYVNFYHSFCLFCILFPHLLCKMLWVPCMIEDQTIKKSETWASRGIRIDALHTSVWSILSLKILKKIQESHNLHAIHCILMTVYKYILHLLNLFFYYNTLILASLVESASLSHTVLYQLQMPFREHVSDFVLNERRKIDFFHCTYEPDSKINWASLLVAEEVNVREMALPIEVDKNIFFSKTQL